MRFGEHRRGSSTLPPRGHCAGVPGRRRRTRWRTADARSARRDTHARLSRAYDRLSYSRLAIFVVGVALIAAAWRGWMAPWWVALPVIAFAGLVVRHDAIVRARDAAARAIVFYERGLARI